MSWLASLLIKSLLSWLADFVTGLLAGWAQMKASEQKNAEIREKVDKAQTPEEIQEALNEAASHLGRRDP